MARPTLSHDVSVNLSTAAILLVDHTPMGMRILTYIFAGFGAISPVRCSTAEDAITAVKARPFDVMVVDASLPGMDGYDFLRWLRRSKLEPNAYTPVILLTGHGKLSSVKQARDCGANFIIAKPLTPRVVLERVLWISRESRGFVESDKYIGPDRRFRQQPALDARRREDHEDAEPMKASP